MKDRIAVIDLGTNTFHLFIVELDGHTVNTLYKEKVAVKIGKNGISKGKIAADAFKRAIHTLKIFRTVIDLFEVTNIIGVATSAIRSAKNGQDLIREIKEKTDIDIQVISGTEEAELIFQGVLAAMKLPNAPQLVMDIGGGSVEFIIGTNHEILWRHSFEIGAQRLLDQFHHTDPIPGQSVTDLRNFLSHELKLLSDAIEEHQPKGLIGCSGTFDHLKEIYLKREKLSADEGSTVFELPAVHYEQIHQELLLKDREARLQIPGMVTLRVDMIVVASCLIRFVLEKLHTPSITACAYALKEGLLFSNVGVHTGTNLDGTTSE